MSRLLRRRRVRGAGAPPPLTGDFSAARFWPTNNKDAWFLANGLTRNGTTGRYDGDVYNPPMPSYSGTTLLSDLGSTADNSAALAAAIAANANNTANHAIVLGALSGGRGWARGIQIAARASNAGWLLIIDHKIHAGTFPKGPSQRVTQADASVCSPLWAHQSNEPAVALMQGSRRVYFAGLVLEQDPAWVIGNAQEGTQRTARGLLDFDMFGLDTSTNWPREIVLDRCVMRGRADSSTQCQRCVYGDAAQQVCVKNCDLRASGWQSSDSQAFYIGRGGSGIQLQNNRITCAWGENVFFGGGGGQVPAGQTLNGIYVRNNLIDFLPEWVDVRLHKNLAESKGAGPTIFEGNVFQGYVGNGTLGNQWYSFVWKGSQAASNVCIVRCNEWRDCYGWVGVSADEYGANNIDVHQNVVKRPATAKRADVRASIIAFASHSGGSFATRVENYRIAYNYVAGPHRTSDGRLVEFPDVVPSTFEQGLRFTDNIVDRSSDDQFGWYGFKSGLGVNNPGSWAAAIAGGTDNVWGRNLVSYISTSGGSGPIGTDIAVANRTAMAINNDLTLASGSPGFAAAEDGGAVGAHIALVASAVFNVETGQ